MRYLKVFIIGILAIISLVFVIENIEVLRQPIQLRLNLYVTNLQTAPLEMWVLTILSFALGGIIVFIYFVYDHIKQRQVIRQLRQNIEIMAMELKRAGVNMEESSTTLTGSQENPSE